MLVSAHLPYTKKNTKDSYDTNQRASYWSQMLKGKGRSREKLRAAPQQQQRIWSERRRDKQWICYITITTYTNQIITAYMDKNYGIMKGTKYIIAYSSKIATAYRQL